ncbi:nucleoside diphosphate kinase regulator [Cognatilysobacter segetis]|uniref:nucleoside diphosphate kinase regulator n=1 Tax=Cognatilysobacter segetis TaxID=2492394 RepID=UPI00105EA6E7|nr:nucleoside diphosphate kinase regulator [Lysobacter segetis]
MSALPRLIMSIRDARRLEALIASPRAAGSATAELLEREIARADVREPADIPPDVVTMNSDVVCVDEVTGVEHSLRLVYPEAADVDAHHVSILAPMGAALLGLSVGQSIDWPMPGGRISRLRVARVTYQPEAAGLPE